MAIEFDWAILITRPLIPLEPISLCGFLAGRTLQRQVLATEPSRGHRQTYLTDQLWLSIHGWRLRRQLLDGIALAVAFLLMTRSGSRISDDMNPD